MNRRGFLKVAVGSAVVAPLANVAAQVPVRPVSHLPEVGEIRLFVEDIYLDDPGVGSHTQNRALPPLASQFHYSTRRIEGRLFKKRWTGRRWEFV